MKNMFMIVITTLCMTFTNLTFAANAAPFGLELGVATFAQTKQLLGNKTSLSNAGANKYSGGKMLEGNGDGLGIDGLSGITFIFDQSEKLVAVLMKMSKSSEFGDMDNGNFAKMLKVLSAKYKLEVKRTPFVGDAYAKLYQGDSIIEVTAPHMSFDMEVRYLTSGLHKAFSRQASSEYAAKKKHEADMF